MPLAWPYSFAGSHPRFTSISAEGVLLNTWRRSIHAWSCVDHNRHESHHRVARHAADAMRKSKITAPNLAFSSFSRSEDMNCSSPKKSFGNAESTGRRNVHRPFFFFSTVNDAGWFRPLAWAFLGGLRFWSQGGEQAVNQKG